jgi:hypothetical protein
MPECIEPVIKAVSPVRGFCTAPVFGVNAGGTAAVRVFDTPDAAVPYVDASFREEKVMLVVGAEASIPPAEEVR